MQWMFRLFTKARPTQRSLFRSIYNILKVIFSLNKRLCDRTLFSLLIFSNRETSSFANWTPGRNFGSKVAACGLLGQSVAPERSEAMSSQCRGGQEWLDAKIRGHEQVASISPPSVMWFHTYLMWEPCVFFSVSYFLPVHTSSFCHEIQSHPNRSWKKALSFLRWWICFHYSVTNRSKGHIS